MSSEMDKFVLQYSVEMKEAISRLEQLNEKVKETNKNGKASTEGFKEFGQNAAAELSRVVPQVGNVASAVKMLGAEFSIAAIAVGVLGTGIKAAMDLRSQYGEQRSQAQQLGIAPARLEEYQRKFANNSNGYVTRDAVPGQLQRLGDMTMTAYTDPSRQSAEYRMLRSLGVSTPGLNQGPLGTNAALQQMAKALSKMTDAEARGRATAAGFNADFASTLRKIGPQNIGQITEMSPGDLKERFEAQQNVDQFNKSLAQLDEKFKELENSLGVIFIPTLTHFVEWLLEVTKKIPKVGNLASDVYHALPSPIVAAQNLASGRRLHWYEAGAIPQTLYGMGRKMFGLKNQYKNDDQYNELNPGDNDGTGNLIRVKQAGDDINKGAKSIEMSGKQAVETQDAANAAQRTQQANMTLAVNMFSGAVSTFSNAVDERQAWAAWAGEVGRAAGLGPGANMGASGARSEVPDQSIAGGQPNAYADLVKKYGEATGVSTDLINRVIHQESRGNPNAVSGVGAEGLMQIMPANKKGLGITNSFDPEQNIKGGTALLKEALKESGGNTRLALMIYHGGPDRSKWGAKTMAYPDQVLGTGLPTRGESRETIQRQQVQQNIAARLGAPVGNIQLGRVNQGDVDWASKQLGAGIRNNVFNGQKDLNNPMLPLSDRARIIQNIQMQQSGLNQLNKYAPQVAETAQAGDRNITIGERAITINVMGTGSPGEVANQVQSQLSDHLGEVINQSVDGMKY